MCIALTSVASTALYQIWAGSKQKELAASSAQLLREYTPYACLMMGLLVGVMEPLGIADRGPGVFKPDMSRVADLRSRGWTLPYDSSASRVPFA